MHSLFCLQYRPSVACPGKVPRIEHHTGKARLAFDAYCKHRVTLSMYLSVTNQGQETLTKRIWGVAL